MSALYLQLLHVLLDNPAIFLRRYEFVDELLRWACLICVRCNIKWKCRAAGIRVMCVLYMCVTIKIHYSDVCVMEYCEECCLHSDTRFKCLGYIKKAKGIKWLVKLL